MTLVDMRIVKKTGKKYKWGMLLLHLRELLMVLCFVFCSCSCFLFFACCIFVGILGFQKSLCIWYIFLQSFLVHDTFKFLVRYILHPLVLCALKMHSIIIIMSKITLKWMKTNPSSCEKTRIFFSSQIWIYLYTDQFKHVSFEQVKIGHWKF